MLTLALKNEGRFLCISIDLQKHSWKFKKAPKNVGTPAYGSCFLLQHFSFYQIFIHFSLARKKERCITILYHVKKMQWPAQSCDLRAAKQ